MLAADKLLATFSIPTLADSKFGTISNREKATT